jgi:hypothetical protein
MSSVLPLASGIVASERVLVSAGRAEDKNSSGAAFAVRPAVATQDAQPDFPREPVVIPVDVLQSMALVDTPTAPPSAAAVYSAVAASVDQGAQAAAAGVNAVAETILAPLAVDNLAAWSQAAYAYAQTMQAWQETKCPRPAVARALPKSKARERR